MSHSFFRLLRAAHARVHAWARLHVLCAPLWRGVASLQWVFLIQCCLPQMPPADAKSTMRQYFGIEQLELQRKDMTISSVMKVNQRPSHLSGRIIVATMRRPAL